MKAISAIAILIAVITASAVLIGSETTDAAPVSAVDIASDITSLLDGETYTFIGEPDDVIKLVISDNNNRIIDGDNLPLPAYSGKLHFDITNTGSGTITFVNMALTNPSGLSNSGGMSITGGKYVFENCTFSGLKKTAVFFYGTANSAEFKDCTFKNNTNKGIAISSGTATYQAEFDIKGCFFTGNTITDGGSWCRGAAIGINGYSVTYVDINISESVFIGNKVIGTSTGSGANNNCDGGAIAVNAENASGVKSVKLNIRDSYFENNFAQDDGGAILVMGNASTPKIVSKIWNCTFTGNTVAGATYWSTRSAGFITVTAGITNGAGGAVNYYGMTDSSVTNCTFYNNGITNVYTAGGTNCGNVGGGGAIGVDTHDYITDPKLFPPAPVLSNNIFVGNYVKKSVYQTSVVLGVDLVTQFGVVPTPYTGNVFVMTGADADRQDPLVISRPITNNGNVGYDNGNTSFNRATPGSGFLGLTQYMDDLGTNTANDLTVANVFTNLSGGVPVKELLGVPVGADGEKGQRYYYMPSPRTDELYRDGSGPYYDSTLTAVDALGNPRDVFPSAGAIEIYWTKFNPGTGAWASVVPTQIDNPSDVTKPYYVIRSLFFATNKMYYVATDVGLPDPNIIAMPRAALIPDNAQKGFVGWRSNQPDMGWWDVAWASANGFTETNVHDFLLMHALSELPKEALILYQPGELIPSTKQVLTAEWILFEYRVDFSLNYADPPAYPDPLHNYWLPSAADITQGGFDSALGIVVPPYVNVPYGDRIYEPKVDPVRAGYAFKGWYKDPGLADAWDFDTDIIEEDTVLYAAWQPVRAVIFHSTEGAFTVTGDTEEITLEIGSLIPLPGTIAALAAPVNSGLTLDGWYLGDALGVDYATAYKWEFPTDVLDAPVPDVMPYEPLHLYAKWVAEVTYHGTGATSGAAPVDPDKYLSGSSVSVLGQGTMVRAGFNFEGWSTTPADIVPMYVEGDTFTITENTDLYPVWTMIPGGGSGGAKMFYIYASADDGSTIFPEGTIYVPQGGSAKFTFSPKEGYKIIAVLIDGVDQKDRLSASEYTFSNVTRDHSIKIVSVSTKITDPVEEGREESTGEWSVLNLICAILALFAGVTGIIAGRKRFRKDEEERRSKTALVLRVLGLIFGIASIILFFLTEDWTLPVATTDQWSLLMFILLAAAFVAAIVSFRFDEAEEK